MTAALRRHDTRDKRIERLEMECARLKRENERLKEKPACNPPPEFFQAYEELWDRAFGRNKQRVHESSNAGTFSLRRRAFHDLCRDDRALDDIMALDKLFRALSLPVHKEASRRGDMAEWHRDIKGLVRVWGERYREQGLTKL